MRKGVYFDVRDINLKVLAKGEFIDGKRVILTEDEESGDKLESEYDLLENIRDDYESAYCIHIPKQGTVEDMDDMDRNIIIPPKTMAEVFGAEGKDANQS